MVFESHHPQACSEHSLVLSAAQIPHRTIYDPGGYALLVPAAYSADAVRELRLYEDENPPPVPKPPRKLQWHDARPGIVAYGLVVCLVAWLAGINALGFDWLAAGRIDGELVRDGQWWRLFTALTLHGSLSHLLGNLIFGTLFGWFAGRLLGPGIAWLAIVIAAAAGNLLNVLLLESAHRSIGASTAVFAALGLVAGYVWRGKLMPQERWVYRLGPIVGGIALLAYTGAGSGAAGENVDVGAHLMGFFAGFAGGTLLVNVMFKLRTPRIQVTAGVLCLTLLAIAWGVALAASRAQAIM